jgi:hypothetical protein
LYSVDLVSEVESASCYYADTLERLSRIPEGPSLTKSPLGKFAVSADIFTLLSSVERS